MAIDMTITGWARKVPNHQWQNERRALAGFPAHLPERIVNSRTLSEVHRLDLSLFVIFEEAALRVSGALVRRAPSVETMNFCAQQSLEEARHREIFWQRLQASCEAIDIAKPAISHAIMIPPLKRFLDRSYEVIDRGDFLEGLILMNLIFEGMAYPLYEYERRYWEPVDPHLAYLIRMAFADESRHVAYGARIVRSLLRDDPARRSRLGAVCREATLLMGEVFDYYIRKFVKLFDSVTQEHRGLFADMEFAPGRLISQTPYEEQIKTIRKNIEDQHAMLLSRAGLQDHG